MRTLAACLLFVACDSSADHVTAPDAGDTTPADTADTTATDTADTTTTDTADTTAADTADTTTIDTADTTADAADTADTTPADTTTTDADATPPAPPAIYLTIAMVPPEMNGSRPSTTPDGPLSFRLRANRARVDLDVVALPESGPFDLADLTIGCSANDASVDLPAAVALAPDHLQVAIDDAHAFPDGAAVTCTATVTTAAGTSTSTYAFDAATLPPELDPFPATDTWLVVLHRDVWTMHVSPNGDGTSTVASTFEPDGVDDFDAPFIEVGLMPDSDSPAAAAIRAHLLARVKAQVEEIYGLDAAGAPTPDGVDLHLYFEGDPGAPDPADFGTVGHRFSMIAMSGDGAPEDQHVTFGRARIDWNNQGVEDDTVYGLGVWPTALVRTILQNAAAPLLFADMRPALGGTPFGLAAGDDLFVGKDVDVGTLPEEYRQRADRYYLLIRFGSLALASILSHEMGHSLGLVPFGPPPGGLFAGVDTDWVVTFAPDAHIDTAGLNIMQTGASVNWLEAASGEKPRFEPLSWAYLRRQLVVGPQVPDSGDHGM